jgi:hypothetical protein
MAVATLTNGASISDSSTDLFYLVDNTQGVNASITLPHANVVGKMIHLIAKDSTAAVGPTLIKINAIAQAGDVIVQDTINNALTSRTFQAAVHLMSNGANKWFVVSFGGN